MTGESGKKSARIFSVVDCAGGEMSGPLSLKLASWASSRGINALVLDARGPARGGARRLGDLSNLTPHLKDGFLRSYLAVAGGFGSVHCDAPLGLKLARNLWASYDLLIAALSSQTLTVLSDIFPDTPALIVASALMNGGMSKTAALVDKMLEGGHLPRPMAFVLSGGDAEIGAKLASRLRVSFWGDSNGIDDIALRALERSAGVANFSPEEINDIAGPLESAPKKPGAENFDLVAREIVSALRQEAQFKNMRGAAGDSGTCEDLRKRVSSAARRMILTIEPSRMLGADAESLVRRVVEDSVGLGPIESLMADPSISEVMINGPDEVYVERAGSIQKLMLKFLDGEHLMAVIERMLAGAGRRIDESSPMVDARLKDGSRLNVIIPPVAIGGSVVTIRKFTAKMRSMGDAVSSGMLTEKFAKFLAACVSSKISIVISGGTGAGKTTLLNILASAIGESERVVTIEDAAELSLAARHVVRLEARPSNIEGAGAVTIKDLVKNALRMRPDRIVVGECRGAEALDMLQAMNTGHEGSLTTVHANSPRDAISRLETMVLMAGALLPLATVREQIVRAIDIIVQVERAKCGARKVSEIVEITGMEGQTPSVQTIAKIDSSGALLPTGHVPKFAEKLKEREFFVSLLCEKL